MTKPGVFETFHEAYVDSLRSVHDEPQFFNAPRGFESRERLSLAFTIESPRERVPYLRARKLNIVFNFAEALWYLSGRDDLELIAHYAPSIRQYSADGRTLTGTAYGRRIFRYGASGLDQWEQAVRVLREDPDSKRAVIQIFDPHELAVESNVDVACTLALQFLVRDGRLHAVAFMRANDAYRGMVSDVFSFTFLQETLATQLGLDVGSYHHHVGSVHVYDPDLERVEAVLEEAAAPPPRPEQRFPAMPRRDNRPDLRVVLEHEEALRRNTTRLTPSELDSTGVDAYWRQVLLLFEAHREAIRDGRVEAATFAALEPFYRWFVADRWRVEEPSRAEAVASAGPRR